MPSPAWRRGNGKYGHQVEKGENEGSWERLIPKNSSAREDRE